MGATLNMGGFSGGADEGEAKDEGAWALDELVTTPRNWVWSEPKE